MVAHDILSRHRLSRRQEPVAPTGNGIVDAVTVTPTADVLDPGAATLAVDASVVRSAPTASVPDFVATGTGAVTLPPTTTRTTSSTADVAGETSVAGATAATSVISMGTVIGACVGALVGAAFLILIGILFYKRSAPKRRGPLSSSARNMHGNNSRALAAQESWDKLDGSGDDKWESQFPSPTTNKEGGEMETVAPMEKLTMFSKKSTPSIRTAYTSHADADQPNFAMDPHPFAAYYPGLAQDMSREELTPRPFLARVDAGPALSWSETGSFNVSLKNRLSSGAMSPSLELVTPHIVSHQEPHQWHSAEVLNYDPEVADQSQFAAQPTSVQSANPFMADNERLEPDRVSVVEPSIPWHLKGKGRDLTDGAASDPFSDETAMPVPQLTHTAASSLTSNDRAIQSLIAAMGMDGNAMDIQDRLRVASMQPSVVSATSVYTEDEDVTQSFPLPPSTKP